MISDDKILTQKLPIQYIDTLSRKISKNVRLCYVKCIMMNVIPNSKQSNEKNYRILRSDFGVFIDHK